MIMYLLHTLLPKFRKQQYFLILEIPSTMLCSFHILGKCLQVDYSFFLFSIITLQQIWKNANTHVAEFILISKRLVPPYNVIKDELNSDDHHTYYCGQESLKRNGIALTLSKSPKCNTCVRSQK